MNSVLSYSRSARVLVVDDTATNLDLMRFALRPQHQVATASSAAEALDWMSANGAPDIILLDVVMPGMDGYELCEQLKRDPMTRETPVIFLTSKSDATDELRGFKAGAVDYIVKPAPALLVRARVNNHLQLKEAKDMLATANRSLSGEVLALEAGIRGLARMATALGKQGGLHLSRIQRYMELTLAHMATQPAWQPDLPPVVIDKMGKASVLYDIGKLGVSAEILAKPGSLNDEERHLVETHAELGGQALQGVIGEILAEAGESSQAVSPQSNPVLFLELARDMALSHHEHWDGNGYPLGLAGEAIPLCAQLVGLMDVYDALLSRRPHKAPWPRQAVLDQIRQGRGTRFSPALMDVFDEMEPTLYSVWQRQTESNERL